MQTPSDLFHSVLGLLIWFIEASLVLARLGVEWLKGHIGAELFTYLVKFITDSIILILNWIISASRWLLESLPKS
ncbi:MAG: hypothetical protein Q8P97_02015 [bacterium]|nr:hypothetical protein [bacterium]